jgi:hypothetical protein
MMCLIAKDRPCTSVGSYLVSVQTEFTDMYVCVCVVESGIIAHGRFVDKAAAFRAEYGVGCDLFFVMGFDTIARVFDRKYYDDLHASMRALFAYVVPNSMWADPRAELRVGKRT